MHNRTVHINPLQFCPRDIHVFGLVNAASAYLVVYDMMKLSHVCRKGGIPPLLFHLVPVNMRVILINSGILLRMNWDN